MNQIQIQEQDEMTFGQGHVFADNRQSYNFSPGPCVLPHAVLKQATDEGMFNYKGSGQSVLELSHRQDEFREISNSTKAEVKKFLNVPDNYKVLLQQGGATMQYTAIVKNLAGLKPSRRANLLVTGMWSNQNLAEMKKHCDVNVVANNITDNDCTRMVDPSQWNIDPEASFFYFCTNETVNGFEFDFETFPFHLIPEGMPVVCDMSSNVGTNNIPWDKISMVFMGAQKNLGTAGCTVMVIKENLFGNADADIPILCDWTLHEKSPDTYYNTPAIFPMYITMLNMKYMNVNGLNHYINLAETRSKLLAECMSASDGYYKTKITDTNYQSRINVVFNIQGGSEMEEKFIKEAKDAGIIQIKGHYFCAGIRISMYNATPVEGVEYLCQFMDYFRAKYPVADENLQHKL